MYASGPAVTAIRVWPSSSGCRVVAIPPLQLVAPTERVECCGSPAGSAVYAECTAITMAG